MVALNLAIFGGVFIVFGSQFGNLRLSYAALTGAHIGYVVAAGLVAFSTIFVGALSYDALGKPRTQYRHTLLTQTASGFVNRLLPAGIGGLGLFAVYLRRCGFNMATATGIVASNNILGFVGNCLLLIAAFVASPFPPFHVTRPHTEQAVYIGVSVAALGIILVVITRTSHRLLGLKRDLFRASTAAFTALRPNRKSMTALIANMALTALEAAALSLAAAAVDVSLPWTHALIALSLGTLLGAVVPTPGGIGVVEAGLLGTLVATGISSSLALPVVLVYRLMTYWLPIIPGIVAFRRFQQSTQASH